MVLLMWEHSHWGFLFASDVASHGMRIEFLLFLLFPGDRAASGSKGRLLAHEHDERAERESHQFYQRGKGKEKDFSSPQRRIVFVQTLVRRPKIIGDL